MKESGNSK
jgi:hypothetical protein